MSHMPANMSQVVNVIMSQDQGGERQSGGMTVGQQQAPQSDSLASDLRASNLANGATLLGQVESLMQSASASLASPDSLQPPGTVVTFKREIMDTEVNKF